MPRFRSPLADIIPTSLLVIAAFAAVSSAIVLLRPSRDEEGLEMWLFAMGHRDAYVPIERAWREQGGPPVDLQLVEMRSLERRLLSSFLAGTPAADVVETERSISVLAWRGPPDAIGYEDVTDRLHAEGLWEQLVPNALTPWTVNGRVYGIPLDVHPVMLAYRADLFAEAGIDPTQAETWDEFMAMTRPMVKDLDGDGVPDRHAIELPETVPDVLIALLLQAGGDLIDERGRPALDSPIAASVLAHYALWIAGPGRQGADVDLFGGAGHRLRDQGYVASWIVPDWRTRTMREFTPGLSGKIRLMPLPAWQPGGRRTSVWGGTMLGFPRGNPDFETAWEFAKRLVFNREIAIRKWVDGRVLPPVREFWSDPAFDEPEDYYGGQASARLFLNLADEVPRRSSSVYVSTANGRIAEAASQLIRETRRNRWTTVAEIEPRARELLAEGQQRLLVIMERNRFLPVPPP